MKSQQGVGVPQKVIRSLLFCLATLLLYLGWPLIGWGLAGISQFFLSPPRTGYAFTVALFSLAVGIQAYSSVEGIRGKRGEVEKLVNRQTAVRYVLVLGLYLALFFITFFDRHAIGIFGEGDIPRWLGVFFCLLGYGLIFWRGVRQAIQCRCDHTGEPSPDHREYLPVYPTSSLPGYHCPIIGCFKCLPILDWPGCYCYISSHLAFPHTG